jgi:hypothetical protein
MQFPDQRTLEPEMCDTLTTTDTPRLRKGGYIVGQHGLYSNLDDRYFDELVFDLAMDQTKTHGAKITFREALRMSCGL